MLREKKKKHKKQKIALEPVWISKSPRIFNLQIPNPHADTWLGHNELGAEMYNLHKHPQSFIEGWFAICLIQIQIWGWPGPSGLLGGSRANLPSDGREGPGEWMGGIFQAGPIIWVKKGEG